ncbi:MAG: hypothetical protein Q7J25_01480 [Vicinamibacterales bacterium]|nr:hypothetical protein [Vicinamibacterales bacterium]
MGDHTPAQAAGRQSAVISSAPERLAVAALFLGVGAVGVYYGARDWLPPLASKHGAGIDAMMAYLLVTTGAIFLAGHLILGYLVWKGSGRTAAVHRPVSRRYEWLLSGTLGLAMGIVAEGGVLAIGIPVWNEYYNATAVADTLTIEVIGQQFMWNVRYPGKDGSFGRTDTRLINDADNPIGLDQTDRTAADDILTQNEIYVPVNRPVRIRLKSKDMIHSFFLPHFRVKQDAVPGMTPEVFFTPTVTGSFEIACAELCGLGHYRMQGLFNVVSDAAFTAWLSSQATAR